MRWDILSRYLLLRASILQMLACQEEPVVVQGELVVTPAAAAAAVVVFCVISG